MFLSGTIATGHLLLFALAFLLCLVFIFITMLYKKESSIPFSSLHGMGFYCKDLVNSDEVFSDKLCQLLGKERIADLEEFLLCFEDIDKSILVDIFSRIGGAYNCGLEKGGACSESIKFTNQKDNTVKYCICSYTYITASSSKELLKIVVLFHDVSAGIEALQGIKHENSILKKDLVYKSNIINSLPFPVWVRDKNFKIQYSNTQFNYLVPKEQQYSAKINIARKEKELSEKAYNTNVVQSEEIYVVINGKRNLYHFYEVPITDSGLVMGTCYDCGDKDQIKSELQRHVAAQSDLLESTASAVAVYGSDMKLKFFNQAFVKMWGLEEHWLVTQPSYTEFLNKLRSDRKLPEQIDFQLFKKEQLSLFTDLTLTHNDFLYLPDGRSLRVIVIPHALGGLLFSYEDMTDRLALERSYNTLTAVQKSTINHLNEGITVFSEDGRLQISNTQFAKMWGVSDSVLGSKPHFVVVIEKILENTDDFSKNESFKEDFFSCINSRKKSRLKIEKTDGSIIDVLFVPLPDGATLICYRDISDTIMVEKILVDKNRALQEADKLKTEFLANMSYELRSPLTSIVGFAGLLEGNHCGKLNKKQYEYVTAINDSSKYLMSLINDILDIVSLEAGYLTLDVNKVDFKQATESVIDLVTQKIKKLDVKLYVSYSEGKFIGIGDYKRIKQVVFRMLSNAIGRLNAKGSLYFNIRSVDNKYLVLNIKDYGEYVPMNDQKQIFDRFYGVNSTEVANNKDNFGMSLVKSIVELHGGRVSFVSKKGQCNILRAIIPLNNADLLSEGATNSDVLAEELN